ncbi:GNAT family N-acetyltransferase [Halopelagius longus]|uniref:GNAT family N-acetyltransferase n=1 Tax=Halopelagius longus TaxID=1236180 RepID=A0A1H1D824_9EURY|nr:GNAT family N-acetyltransferase [Halopelagius longus]RDI71204.1 GNAT family N-acetyltransferase [Halopelagius longus]SDQ72338.1 Ribosomal protein S18 acetylase RimI [Halopelagius longus]
MIEVTVREATADDVPAVRRIARRGWNAAYGDLLSQETIDAAMATWYAPDATRATVEGGDAAYFVAEPTGDASEPTSGDRGTPSDVVGFAAGGPSETAGVATLSAIYVDPDHWGGGVGTALLERVEEFCREEGCETLEIRVLSENRVGRSFYRSKGYEAVEKRDTKLFGEAVREFVFRGRLR